MDTADTNSPERPMRILLAYSTYHFDPACPEKARKESAGVLARTLYTMLSRFGEVDYVDGLNPPTTLPHSHYDLLVSILGGITPLCRMASFGNICLFAVNMHPAERNAILDRFHDRYRVCDTRSVDKAIVSLETLDDIERADAIFLVGNDTVRESFLNQGIAPQKVRALNYASALPLPEPSELEASGKTPRFVYVATEMCLRKGFDIMVELFTQAAEEGRDFHLSIIGREGNKTYASKLEQLKLTLGDKLTVEGWVPAETNAYPELLRKNDFVILPSLEEGQVGSVLDALACGLIPIVTREAGIDISPLGFLEGELGSAENKAIFNSALEASEEEIANLKQVSLAHYIAHHLPWETELQKAFEYFLETGDAHDSESSADEEAATQPSASAWSRYVMAPLAYGARYLCPSKQKRKRLYNYYRTAR